MLIKIKKKEKKERKVKSKSCSIIGMQLHSPKKYKERNRGRRQGGEQSNKAFVSFNHLNRRLFVLCFTLNFEAVFLPTQPTYSTVGLSFNAL